MDIWRLLSAAVRRWFVLLPVLLLSGVVAFAVGDQVQPEYTAQASVLLVPPETPVAGNPYADLDTAGSSTAIVLQSGPTRSDFAARGLSADYDVSPVSRTPILRFTVRASDAQVAVATAQALIDGTGQELLERQQAADVAEQFHVTVDVLEPASGATESSRSQLQAQVGVFAVGGVLAFLAAVFADDLALLWQQRRQKRDDSAPPSRRTPPEVKRKEHRAPEPRETGREGAAVDDHHDTSTTEDADQVLAADRPGR